MVNFFYIFLITSIMLFINIILIGASFWKIRNSGSNMDQPNQEKYDNIRCFKIKTLIYLNCRSLHILAVYLVTDFAWIMDVITWTFLKSIPSEIVTISDFFGYSQGIWIFVVCVLRMSTMKLIKRR